MHESFWNRVDADGDCWLWQGYIGPKGYGQFGLTHRSKEYAHRMAWILLVGAIPQDKEIDHLCRVRHCVNPDHMQAVTGRTNKLRGYSFSGQQARQTECRHGHPFTRENTYIETNGQRHCKTCDADRHRRAYAVRNRL